MEEKPNNSKWQKYKDIAGFSFSVLAVLFLIYIAMDLAGFHPFWWIIATIIAVPLLSYISI